MDSGERRPRLEKTTMSRNIVYKTLLLATAVSALVYCASAPKEESPDNELNPQYQYEKAVVAMNYGFPDQAIEYLNIAVHLDPGHVPSYKLLGHVLASRQNHEAALKAFEKSLELQPDLAEVYAAMGAVYRDMGLWDEAESAFLQFWALEENARAAFDLAKFFYDRGKPETALEYIRKAIEKDRTQAATFNLEGVILNKLGRYSEAATSFKKGLVLAPNDIALGINLGIAHVNAGEIERARDFFTKLLPRIEDIELKRRVEKYLEDLK